MAITTVLFDLDGTLLPMDQDHFVKMYFGLLAKTMAPDDPEALIKGVWTGTKAMMTNNGSKTNEDAFWDAYCALLGQGRRSDEPALRSFYENEFEMARSSCGCDPRAAQTIALVKSKGLKAVLATNPIFPRVATQARARWAGLNLDDFELYTTYENSCHSKPNLAYYVDVMNVLGVSPEECLMVGNDVGEDMIAETLGMKVFLVPECIINKEGKDISRYPQGDFDDLIEYVKEQI